MKLSIRIAVVLLAVATALALTACGGDDDSGDDTTPADQPAMTEAEDNSAGGGGAYGGGVDSGGGTGGGDADSAAGGGDQLALAADPSGALAYDTSELTASAGEVTVDFTNDSETGHNVVFERDGQQVAGTEVITASSATVSFNAEPGEYRFYCSVPGHAEAGMEGTLTVE